jgi:hypothetical protein
LVYSQPAPEPGLSEKNKSLAIVASKEMNLNHVSTAIESIIPEFTMVIGGSDTIKIVKFEWFMELLS